MTRRNSLQCLLLSVITLGIYDLVWFYETKREMNALGAEIPGFWQIFIPLVSLLWLDKFCEGVQKVTRGGMGRNTAAFLLLFLSPIAVAIIQNKFNKLAE